MSNGSGNHISFTELQHARNLVEMFDNLPDNFEAYWDKEYHSDPNNPVSAAQAGAIDAKKSPPLPLSESESPTEKSTPTYIGSLYESASTFFESSITKCRDRFDELQQLVDDSLSPSNRVWQDIQSTNSDGLSNAVKNLNECRVDCDTYANDYKHIIGNRILNPEPHSVILFACIIIFVVVFEFVWVWYFLSGQLGFAAAINGSLGAATAVVLIAYLFALCLANTEGDLAENRRKLAYGGIAFCVVLFLFSLGLLSAWRADSTGDGLAFIIDGYRSMTQLDVFVTALINFGGVIVLTFEFKKFICPYPLYYYKDRIRNMRYYEEKVEEERINLEKSFEARENEINSYKAQIESLLNEVDQFAKGAENHIGAAVRKLDKKASEIRKSYIDNNVVYRTIDAFPEPDWFREGADKFTVKNVAVEYEIGELIRHIKSQTNQGSWTPKLRLEQTVDLALQRIRDKQIEVRQLFEHGSERAESPISTQT